MAKKLNLSLLDGKQQPIYNDKFMQISEITIDLSTHHDLDLIKKTSFVDFAMTFVIRNPGWDKIQMIYLRF